MSTPANERIEVVDVLRAFALFGIMVTHSGMEFLVGPPPYENFGQVHAFDPIVQQVIALLTTGKFFMIFSFLFGLSFAIQIDNAARKGTAFAGRFSWRLTVLLLIGCVHSIFFSGDILVIYALLGFLLLPMRNVRTKVLLWVAVVLALNIPGLLLGIAILNAPPQSPEQQQAAAAYGQQFAEMARHFYEIKSSGTLAELAQINTSTMFGMKLLYMFVSGRFWITFACFLLGMCAGRVGLFVDTPAHRAAMRRILVIGGGVAAVSSILVLLFPAPPMSPTASLGDVLAGFASSVQNASVAAFLVALVSLLYWRAPHRGPLPALAPMGRMGLTTYLMQTAFGLIVFYGIGFGLMGKLGAGLGALVGLLFCVAWVFVSRAWLARFTMGPFEWLWRSLTYFRLQPLARRGPVAA